MKSILALSALAFAATMAPAADVEIKPDDPKLSYSDCFKVDFVDAGQGVKAARFSRPGKSGAGYQHDNPGARLRFRTDAPGATVHLRYNELHVSKSARKPIGVYMIDGKLDPKWTFTTKQSGVQREVENVDVPLKSPAKGFHTYEIVMPYGDAVDVLGISVPEGAEFENPPPRPKTRCAFYGDSVTHGFTAVSIAGTYPFLIAQTKDFQMVNLGIGGRGTAPDDGKLLASAKCDLAVVHIGVNDWQGGRPTETTQKNMVQFFKDFRTLQPNAWLYVVTPLWVSEKWKPSNPKFPLAGYRKAIEDALKESGIDKVVLLDGTKMIDNDEKLFDSVLVHPNDAGFKQMAERIAKAIK